MAQSMGRLLEIMAGMKRLQNILSGAMTDDQDTHVMSDNSVCREGQGFNFLFVCLCCFMGQYLLLLTRLALNSVCIRGWY